MRFLSSRHAVATAPPPETALRDVYVPVPVGEIEVSPYLTVTPHHGSFHAQISSCCCSDRGRRRLWVDRLNEGACCSSYDDEQSHYRAHEDDGRFGEFAHRALSRLFAHLPVSTASRSRARPALMLQALAPCLHLLVHIPEMSMIDGHIFALDSKRRFGALCNEWVSKLSCSFAF
jgi:hypothetical protein